MQEQSLERWRVFLNKVMTRLRDVLAEAEAGCRDVVTSHATDPLPLGNVLGALGTRKQGLEGKISDAWREQASKHLAEAPPGGGAVDPRALAQGEREMHEVLAWMEDTWEHFRVRWSAEAMRAMWPHVRASMQKPVTCHQCSAPIEPPVRHEASSVSCASCGRANEVAPEPLVYTYFAMAPHAIAEEQVLEQRLMITRFRRDVAAWRNAETSRNGSPPEEGIESLRRWEAMERSYWSAYAAAKARLDPATPEEQQRVVDARMKQFTDQQLSAHAAWRSR